MSKPKAQRNRTRRRSVCIFKIICSFVWRWYGQISRIIRWSTERTRHVCIVLSFCKIWQLEINSSKTNAMIFSKGWVPNSDFTIDGVSIEVVSEYKYLGVLFSRGGSFLAMKKHIARQASKAVFSLLKKARSLLLPIDIQTELFNKPIKPILLYGCEIWGFGDLRVLEQVQLIFLKFIINIKKSTPNCIVYGETGILPWKSMFKVELSLISQNLYNKKQTTCPLNYIGLQKTCFDNRNNPSFLKWF